MKAKSMMTTRDAGRIQSAAGKNQFSKTFKTGFYQRAQSVAAKGNGGLPSTTGRPSGGGRDNNPPKK
ncbi:MAG: hypothetical protein WBC06_06445 [Chitinophagaceae bacterium]|nr:hypothetical protein [Chitinophagaceae bacterium]HQV87232.1 hypothetical protein [Chitinophagaceae bacterium]HQX72129.1 hypothetical protein [Chitinophagaceae bacterium]HQZ75661.1 hypothetical protein [Chitinophagaceae bacterium]